MGVDFKARLAKMGKAYKTAEAAKGLGETNLEAGKYRANITGAELKEVNGKLNIEWEYTVAEGDFENEVATNLDGIEREEAMPYLKKKLNMLGYDADTVDLAADLPTILAEIVDASPLVVIQVKKNDDFVNIYLNKVEDSEASEEEGDAEEVEETEAEEEVEEVEEASIEVGSTVLYTPKGQKKAKEFLVEKIDEKKKTAKLKGLVNPVGLDLLELAAVEEVEEAEEADAEAQDSEDEAELTKGAKVEVDINGKPSTGIVLSVDEDDETAKVKLDKTKKVVKVAFDQLTLLA